MAEPMSDTRILQKPRKTKKKQKNKSADPMPDTGT